MGKYLEAADVPPQVVTLVLKGGNVDLQKLHASLTHAEPLAVAAEAVARLVRVLAQRHLPQIMAHETVRENVRVNGVGVTSILTGHHVSALFALRRCLEASWTYELHVYMYV